MRLKYLDVPGTAASGGSGAGGARRASERDLPSRLAAEPVKPSKSTPALHQAAVGPPPAQAAHPAPAHHHYTYLSRL